MLRREFLITTIAGILAGARRLPAADNHQSRMDRVIRLIQAQVEGGVLESAVLHVTRGDFSLLRSFGKASSGDAIFLLASITKPMTATALMVLSDQRELSLSDKVVKFIPEFSEGPRKDISIRQLLTHTSGLPDQLPENDVLRKRHAPLDEFVAGAIRTPLLFEPGTQYSYQSMGILLAAEVAQRITGMRFRDFLAREVFEPLGMKHSVLGLGAWKVSDTVRSQTEFAAVESGAGSADAKDWDWNSPYWRDLGAPWGGAHSSAVDVTRFLRSFLHPEGRALKASTARQMIRDHNQGLGRRRGIGFGLGPDGFGKHCSPASFGHTGSTGTMAWADPEKDLTCVILTSLPASKSKDLILDPVSDLVSAETG